MLTEDYCSKKVTKLLKEKGFKNPQYYNSLINMWQDTKVTHQMVMKWLRAKDIDIVILPLFKLNGGRIYCYEVQSETDDIRTGQFDTYEEAVEAALKYSLENLI